MLPLDRAIQEKKETLEDFRDITLRILNYLPDVLSDYFEKGDYRIYISRLAGTEKYVRPINQRLFISTPNDFVQSFQELEQDLRALRGAAFISPGGKYNIDRCLYTIQQALGAGFDLLVNPNSARKHVGNRFEELMKAFFSALGIANKRIVLQIPYDTDEGEKNYKCENDLILSPFPEVQSTSQALDIKEIVVSVKTTSKDRMGKMFIDKMLLQRFVKQPQKVIGIFLNDVQRKGDNNISFTLVSNLFMVYSKFLTELDGVYYLDPPPMARRAPFNRYMKSFSDLVVEDLARLFREE